MMVPNGCLWTAPCGKLLSPEIISPLTTVRLSWALSSFCFGPAVRSIKCIAKKDDTNVRC